MQTPEPSRFKRRLQARRGGQPDSAVMTEEDGRTLAGFEADLVAVTDLLHAEIDAIGAGALETVTELYDRKAELLKRIELKMPVVEPFLRDRLDAPGALRDRVAAFRDAVEEDSLLLERMSQATAAIMREIEKIRDRHSLNGLYGKRGQKVIDGAGTRQQIDKTI